MVLNPGTPLNVLDYVWDLIDGVLIMTVNPGFGGQAYIPAMTEKIKTLKKIIDEKNLPVHIQVDGGSRCIRGRSCCFTYCNMFPVTNP